MATKNNRKHTRIDSLNLISYVCIDENNLPVTQGMGRTLNVSEGGILLETHVQLNSQHTVSLTIGMEDDLLKINGRVTFSKTGSDGKSEAGIQFFEMDKAALQMLRKYARTFREQKQCLDSMGIKIT